MKMSGTHQASRHNEALPDDSSVCQGWLVGWHAQHDVAATGAQEGHGLVDVCLS